MSNTSSYYWSINLKRKFVNLLPEPKKNEDEKFLFIVCMNNSGSTLLERILGDCENVIGFVPTKPDKQVNGQQYALDLMPVPAKLKPKTTRVWTESSALLLDESQYDWAKIKVRWRKYWSLNPRFKTANPRIFLEKSTPNVLRAEMLQTHFDDSYFIQMVRNPYAVCEGIHRRMGYSFERCVRHWLECSKRLIYNEGVLQNTILLRYEDLSEDSQECERRVKGLLAGLEDINLRSEVTVHSIEGKKTQGIVNLNDKQIARLTEEQIKEISTLLAGSEDVVNHFGYKII